MGRLFRLAVTIRVTASIFLGGSGKNHFDGHNPYKSPSRARRMWGCDDYAKFLVKVADKMGQKRGGFFDVGSLYLKFVMADC